MRTTRVRQRVETFHLKRVLDYARLCVKAGELTADHPLAIAVRDADEARGAE